MVELNEYLTADNATELLAACGRQSCEQIELLLAARLPKPDVRDLVRRLPAKTRSAALSVNPEKARRRGA